MDGLSMAEDRVSILDAQQESWQPCELSLLILHSDYLVAERHYKLDGVSIVRSIHA